MALRQIVKEGDSVLTKKCRPVVKFDDRLAELIDDIIAYSGKQETLEGCLSIPGKWGYTVRPDYVKVKAQDRHGDEFAIDGKDLLAKAFCHELDHLEGILFTQVATRMLTPAEIEEMNS